MKKKMILGILILFLAALGYYKFTNKPEVGEVVTEEAKLNSLNLSYQSQGVVKSKKTINVFSNSEAIVSKVFVRNGEYVKKGTRLLELKSKDEDIKKLNLETNKIVLEKSRKNYEDIKKLYEIGGASKDELKNSEIQFNDALIKYKKSYNDYNSFEKYVVSPISGVILSSHADVNFNIDTRKPLFEISDTENLELELELVNGMAKNVKLKDKVTIKSESLDANLNLEGEITRISNISFKSKFGTDNITKINAKLKDYSNLKPGDYVEATIFYKLIENKVIVPFQYVTSEIDNGISKNYIYIVKNGVVERKEVELGDNDGLNFEIKKGIKAGDLMLYNSNGRFKVGDKIK